MDGRTYYNVRFNLYAAFFDFLQTVPFKVEEDVILKYLSKIEPLFINQRVNMSQIVAIITVFFRYNAIPIDYFEYVDIKKTKGTISQKNVFECIKKITTVLPFDDKPYREALIKRVCSILNIPYMDTYLDTIVIKQRYLPNIIKYFVKAGVYNHRCKNFLEKLYKNKMREWVNTYGLGKYIRTETQWVKHQEL